MDEASLSRRRALQLSGAVGVGALAGCLSNSDSGAVPSYAQYLAPTENNEITVFYTVLEEREGEGSGNETGSSNQTNRQLQDPLLSSALSPALAIGFLAGFTLGPTGLDALLGTDAGFAFGGETGGNETGGNESDGDTDEAFETKVDEMFLVGDTLVMAGTIDTDEVDELLGETSTGPFGLIPVRYEQSEEVGDHTFYTPELAEDELDGNVTVGGEGEDGNSPIAVGAEEVLVGPRAEIERILGAKTGERERASDAFADFEWLLETAGSGDTAVATYGADGVPEDSEDGNESGTGPGIGSPEPGEPGVDEGGAGVGEGDSGPGSGIGSDPGTGGAGGNESGGDFEEPLQELSQQALGVAGSGVIDEDSEEVEAEFAAVFEGELSEDDRELIEEEFGTDAEDVSFEFDGSRMSVTGTYSEAAIDE
jgi:hypothetical protein